MYYKFILCCLLIPLLFACGNKESTPDNQTVLPIDSSRINPNDTIRAVTLYSSISYFQYKMQAMGYEYDLIKDFAASRELVLDLSVAENIPRMIEMLENGETDIIAYPVQIDNELKQKFLFCGIEGQSTQVLVQKADKKDTLLTDVTQLIGKEIFVKPDTRYATRLKNLDVELGGGIQIHEVSNDSISEVDLIEMVSKGEIRYTVSDNNIARLNKTYFWNLDINLNISFPQRSSWMVRKNDRLLADAINKWAETRNVNISYKATLKRYFELSKSPYTAELSEVKDGNISPFDDIFKKYARIIGWDWQLLAAISYQESRFKPDVVSWAGAEGLMGIMPNTAKALGISPHELKNPDKGIQTGVDCLRRFRQGFLSIEDSTEQIKFTLASYNAGIGHIYDAQKLAKKYGKNPELWSDVVEYVKLKNDPKYYNDPVCKHGYLRGSETVAYVHDVMQRYQYYKEKTSK